MNTLDRKPKHGDTLPTTFTTGYLRDLAEARRRILARQARRHRDRADAVNR